MLVTHLNSGHAEQETYNEVKHIRPHTHTNGAIKLKRHLQASGLLLGALV